MYLDDLDNDTLAALAVASFPNGTLAEVRWLDRETLIDTAEMALALKHPKGATRIVAARRPAWLKPTNEPSPN